MQVRPFVVMTAILLSSLLPPLVPPSAMAVDRIPVLVVRPEDRLFAEVSATLGRELGPSFAVTEAVLVQGRDLPAVTGIKPRVVVALDNKGVTAARAIAPGIPMLAGMGLGLRQELSRFGAGGVTYEVAPFSIVTRFQEAIPTTVARVVAPCWAITPELQDGERQLQRAGIAFTPVPLGDEVQPDAVNETVRRWLHDLRLGEHDVVLVPADNRLVGRHTLLEWRAAMRRTGRPFITSFGELVNRNLGLCLFAATPDVEGMAAQLAEQVAAAADGDGPPPILRVEPPVRVRCVVDQVLLRRFGLHEAVP